jgi:hypothetical protein
VKTGRNYDSHILISTYVSIRFSNLLYTHIAHHNIHNKVANKILIPLYGNTINVMSLPLDFAPADRSRSDDFFFSNDRQWGVAVMVFPGAFSEIDARGIGRKTTRKCLLSCGRSPHLMEFLVIVKIFLYLF